MDKHGSQLKLALLAGMMIATAGAVLAQQAPANDAATISIFNGTVAQYSLMPRGDVDGFILEDGTEVFWPPHFSTELVFSVRPGDAVTIHGSKVGVTPMVAAESVTNDASSVTVANMSQPSPPKQLEDEGRIKAQLHDRRGTLNGVLFDDGTIVRLPPPEAERLAANLAVGQPLYARGDGVVSPLGKVIAAHEIGPEKTHLVKIADSLFERWKQDIFGGRGDDVPPAAPPSAPLPKK